MSKLVRGPGMFICLTEEGGARSIIVGVISTISRTRDSAVELRVNNIRVNPDGVQRIHGEFREQPKIPGEEPMIFNCALLEYGFKRLYRCFGQGELNVEVHIPAYSKENDTHYGPMQIQVPKKWYQELKSEE